MGPKTVRWVVVLRTRPRLPQRESQASRTKRHRQRLGDEASHTPCLHPSNEHIIRKFVPKFSRGMRATAVVNSQVKRRPFTATFKAHAPPRIKPDRQPARKMTANRISASSSPRRALGCLRGARGATVQSVARRAARDSHNNCPISPDLRLCRKYSPGGNDPILAVFSPVSAPGATHGGRDAWIAAWAEQGKPVACLRGSGFPSAPAIGRFASAAVNL